MPLSSRPPSRRSAIAPFHAMDVLAAANALDAAGRRIMHMEIGEPGAPTPDIVREAARAALEGGRIRYTDALGWRPLRERIALHYRERYGVDVDPGRVVVTTGSSGGFNLAFLAAFDAGDRVAIATPGYPAYANILRALDLEVVELRTRAEDRHAITPALVEAAHAQKPLAGLIVAEPQMTEGDERLQPLFLERAVDERQPVTRQAFVENNAAGGRLDDHVDVLTNVGTHNVLVIVLERQVHQVAAPTQTDLRLCFDDTCIES